MIFLSLGEILHFHQGLQGQNDSTVYSLTFTPPPPFLLMFMFLQFI